MYRYSKKRKSRLFPADRSQAKGNNKMANNPKASIVKLTTTFERKRIRRKGSGETSL